MLRKNILLPCLAMALVLSAITGVSQITNPRPWAEWEQTRGIIMHQPNFYPETDPSPVDLLVAEEWDSLYAGLIRGLFEEEVEIYYILDTNDRPEYHSDILDTMYISHGIDIFDPSFHVVTGCKANYSSLTKWTRDHGPMNVYKNEVDTLYFYLFRDDYKGAGGVIRDYLGMPDTVFMNSASGNISSDGGNYIVDGDSMGIINGGLGAVLPELRSYFGLDTVYSLPDYLEHADYYLKLVNEETLVLSGQKRENYLYGTEPYTFGQDSALLEGLVSFLQDQVVSQYGRPMKVFQVPNPPSVRDDSLRLWWYTQYASYTNSLIVNRSVFVPVFDLPASDSLALAIYREAMPGYRIVPVYARRGATGGGGVHCLTNSVAAEDPVLITHPWHNDTVDQSPGYEIMATIRTRSGVQSAEIMWSAFPGGPWQSSSMQNVSEDAFRGTIPRPEGVEEIWYYISAGSNSGRTGLKPIVAPEFAYHFHIKGGAPGWIPSVHRKEGTMKIFPDPADNYVRIDWSGSLTSDDRTFIIYMYDLSGRLVMKKHFDGPERTAELYTGSLGSGQYFIVLMNGKGEFLYEKVVIM